MERILDGWVTDEKSRQWNRRSPNVHPSTDRVVDPAKIVGIDRNMRPRDTLASWGEYVDRVLGSTKHVR